MIVPNSRGARFCPTGQNMGELSIEVWGLIVLIIAASVLGVLYTLSSLIRDFDRSLALKNEVEALHKKHAETLAAIQLQEALDAAKRAA